MLVLYQYKRLKSWHNRSYSEQKQSCVVLLYGIRREATHFLVNIIKIYKNKEEYADFN